MLARYATAVTTGSLITVALFWAMQTLIHLQPGARTEPRDRHFLDWVLPPERDTAVEERRSDIDVVDLTTVLLPPRPSSRGDGDLGLTITLPRGDPGVVPESDIDLATPDNPLIAIVRVRPSYPPVAQQRGLEGWVDVRFDVTEYGLVTNVVVIGSSHHVFERAAIKAAERFRFKAPVIDGVAQPVSNVEYRFRFDMET